ncbi:MAG: hypothetical protein KDA90_23290 [Planctomycetaceae bacterium]|nr:hypothetical protein [Planctomycetaceae bacterium]
MIDPPVQRRLQGQFYRLEGVRCRTCGFASVGTRPTCAQCRTTNLCEEQFSPHGELVQVTAVNRPISAYASQPLQYLALVKLDAGPTIMAAVADTEFCQPEPGMRGTLVTRRLFETSAEGLIFYGYKFRPDPSNIPSASNLDS